MIDNITLDNLHIGCKASNKAEVIAMIGAECKAKGYVNQECVHFLLEREHQVSTFFWGMASPCHICRNPRRISFSKPALRSFSSLMALSGIAAT